MGTLGQLNCGSKRDKQGEVPLRREISPESFYEEYIDLIKRKNLIQNEKCKLLRCAGGYIGSYKKKKLPGGSTREEIVKKVLDKLEIKQEYLGNAYVIEGKTLTEKKDNQVYKQEISGKAFESIYDNMSEGSRIGLIRCKDRLSMKKVREPAEEVALKFVELLLAYFEKESEEKKKQKEQKEQKEKRISEIVQALLKKQNSTEK